MRQAAAAVLPAVWLAIAWVVPAPSAAVAAPSLTWQTCPTGTRTGQSGAVMRCGTFKPGEQLAGQPVRLAATRLQAHPDGPTPHPVIYVPGGPGDPGGQGDDALSSWRVFQQRAGWPRDLVVFDPRGTGRSTPRPHCPADGTLADHALAHCFQQLGGTTAQRLGLTAQVEDLHRLVAALGQGRAVLWAESYGAVIARRLAVRHPQDVQLLVLDSPVLRPRRAQLRQRSAFRRRRAQLIAGCDRHPACRLGVPSLSIVLTGLIRSRAAKPVTIDVAQVPYRSHPLHVDGDTVRAVLMLTSYDEHDDAAVRDVLRAALMRPQALAALAGPLLALGRRQARTAPVYWSTRCQSDAARSDANCRDWPVAKARRLDAPGVAPALVISGTRDPLTPASAAARVVLRHPGWQWLPVRGRGHGALAGTSCARRVVRRFIVGRGRWLGAIRCRSDRVQIAAERYANDAEPVHR